MPAAAERYILPEKKSICSCARSWLRTMTWPWPPSDHVAITAHRNPHTHKPRQAISKKFLTMEVEPTDEASVGQKAQVSGTCRWPRDLSLTTVAPASLLQFTSVATRIKAVPCHLLKGRLKAKLWFIDESACYLAPPPPPHQPWIWTMDALQPLSAQGVEAGLKVLVMERFPVRRASSVCYPFGAEVAWG